MFKTKLLVLCGLVFTFFMFGSLSAKESKTTTNTVDAVKVWANEMMDPDPEKLNTNNGNPVRYGTKTEPGSENIVRWCVQNAEDWMLINSDDPASGPYSMTISIGGERIPSDNCWLDLRREDAPVAGYNVPFDASGTDRVTFWIKAEPGTAPLWFLIQGFQPDYDGTTYSGDKQETVNAFIDGETIIVKDGNGGLKVLRDNHFNGEWQFVSLPWEFLTMSDSAAVAELLPWSLAWEGSSADSRDDVAFRVDQVRTVKWFTKPASEFLKDQYWESADNLWGPYGINPERATWEIDEIMFDTFNTDEIDDCLTPEVDVWANEMMDPDPEKLNTNNGNPVRYGTKTEPGSENIVRWCVQNAEDWMLINSDDPASGPYSMTISIGGERIPSDNCWLDLRREDAPVAGYNVPFDASNTDRVTFWIKAEPGTAPLWFLIQGFQPDYDGTTYSGDKQETVNAFIDGETIIVKDGNGGLKVLRDNHFNGEWQFVSLPWEFLTMSDSAAVAELLPWSLAWEGSSADSRDDVAFRVDQVRTVKWFTKPASESLKDQYWESADNLWGPYGINPERATWELDEIKFQKSNSCESYPAEIAVWDNAMMDPDPEKLNTNNGNPVRYGTKTEPGCETIVRWCVQNAEDWMLINSDNPASGPYSMTISIGGERIPSDNCWLDLRREDAPVAGYNVPFDASETDRVSFWIKAEPGTAPLWFLVQGFQPDYDGTTYSGDKQETVNAFIDGETVIDINELGELAVVRDRHFTGEWQYVSLPWKFLTMSDSAAVDAILPWSLAWEGSSADSREDVAFRTSEVRTLKWFTKPASESLKDQYWESADNLWGPYGINPERATWEIDAVYFTSGFKPREGFTTGIEDLDKERIPASYTLYNAYPNPFNPSTTIRYTIPVSNMVSVDIYNVMGQKIRTLVNEYKTAGTYDMVWDGLNDAGNNISSGIYFVKMQASHFNSVQKVTLIK